ncbi:MAG: hypothetical protein LUD81_01870 [Clostridiales bacterium]|nr:hypothetical protein [Clostridiales bacterium]
MKKADIFVICGIVLMLIIILSRIGKRENLYSEYVGKDTHRVYGDGAYQMATGHDENGYIIRTFYSCKYNTGIIYEIRGTEETGDFLYVYGLTYKGDDAYAVVSLADDTLKYYSEAEPEFLYRQDMTEAGDLTVLTAFEKFTEEERKILTDLKNGSGREALDLD